MATRFYVVDAFSKVPFSGNPAAVVPLDSLEDSAWMQQVAAEINLSETAFVEESPDSNGSRRLRWFTPATEVDLCGHATLATAHVLVGPQRFQTRSGELSCKSLADGWIEMDLPADEPSAAEDISVGLLNEALPKTSTLAVARGVSDLLVEIASLEELDALVPNFDRLALLSKRGVIVTTQGDSEFHFYSRWFGPAVGVNEDPVTGSAHCTLAGYWAAKLGRSQFLAQQRSARSGEVRVEVDGDRVKIAGQAISVSEGTLFV